MQKLKIIFMGTPEFAVASLDRLVQDKYEIAAVITAPDKPAGRGRQLAQSDVKKYAIEKGLKVLQPTNLKDKNFLDELASLNANLQVVVAFRMLPEQVWDMPELGTINLHASLLPHYRGAAPINWAIINGESETGVTTFFITHKIDTGDLILQERVKIGDDETAGELHDRLMIIGANLVLKSVQAIERGDNPRMPQNFDEEIKSAPKIFKEDCRINWELPLDTVYNFIRGLSPHPAAWTTFNDKLLKVYSASKVVDAHSHPDGMIKTDGKNYIDIAVKGGYIRLNEIQAEGRKKMQATELLKGLKTSPEGQVIK